MSAANRFQKRFAVLLLIIYYTLLFLEAETFGSNCYNGNNMKLETVLITGGTGLMGKGIEETAPTHASTIITHLHEYTPAGRSKYITADVLDKAAMRSIFEKYRFDAVVHCAGIANVDVVERNQSESETATIAGTKNIVHLCKEFSSYLIYVSTNAVFDGRNAPYGEDAPVCPINAYGRIKTACEKLAATELENCSIARPILMYGWNRPETRKNPVSWMVETLRTGKPLKLVNDVFENPLYNIQCGKTIWAMLEKKPKGVVHIAGKDIMNRYDFGLKVAEVFGLDKNLIIPVDSSFFPEIAPRPKNTSFITRRMEKELGIDPMPAETALKDMLKTEPR